LDPTGSRELCSALIEASPDALFVADSDAEAERIARKAHETWFDNLAWLWKVRGTFPPIAIAASIRPPSSALR